MAMGIRAQAASANSAIAAAAASPDQARLYPSIATETKVSPLAEAFLKHIISLLPSEPVCQALVAIYFADLAWSWRCVNRTQFNVELQEFFDLVKQNRFAAVDPAWIALLLALLANVLTSITDGQVETVGFTDIPQEKAQTYLEASKVALSLSCYMEVPQVRCIQVRV
jgi:hypothetical protein